LTQPNLKSFILSSNNLHGSLPYDLGFLGSLKLLQLDNNFLTGTIPQMLTASPLKSLKLDNNGFSGQFPVAGVSLTTISKLRVLSLHANSLTGDLNPLCALPLETFTADLSDVQCDCCTDGVLEEMDGICS
jgi:hypothetical protein